MARPFWVLVLIRILWDDVEGVLGRDLLPRPRLRLLALGVLHLRLLALEALPLELLALDCWLLGEQVLGVSGNVSWCLLTVGGQVEG